MSWFRRSFKRVWDREGVIGSFTIGAVGGLAVGGVARQAIVFKREYDATERMASARASLCNRENELAYDIAKDALSQLKQFDQLMIKWPRWTTLHRNIPRFGFVH